MDKALNFHILLEAHSPAACERKIHFKILLFVNIVLTNGSDFVLKHG